MAEEKYSNDGNKRVDRGLSLPEYCDEDRNTIYKLRLSMKRRLSPRESMDTPSPVEAGEVRNLLHRLVEIDNESRKLVCKVFKLLEKDETLEAYVKERIEDPKVSKMWQLVEQVLAQQDMELNVNDAIKGDDYDKYITNDRSIKEKDEKDKEKANDRFKVKNIGSGNEPAGNSRATAGATTSTTAPAATSSSSTTRGSK